MANCCDPKNPMTRDQVFAVLQGEREYQEKRWGYPQPDGTFKEPAHGVCDYMVYMRHYLAKAEEAAATKPGSIEALEQLRKVVTLGIACFELNGVPKRSFDLCLATALNPQVIVNMRTGKPVAQPL